MCLRKFISRDSCVDCMIVHCHSKVVVDSVGPFRIPTQVKFNGNIGMLFSLGEINFMPNLHLYPLVSPSQA